MNSHDKQVVRHQLYRSGGQEVVLDSIVYDRPTAEDKRKVDHYLVRPASREEGSKEVKLGKQFPTQDLQPLGRVVMTLEAA